MLNASYTRATLTFEQTAVTTVIYELDHFCLKKVLFIMFIFSAFIITYKIIKGITWGLGGR